MVNFLGKEYEVKSVGGVPNEFTEQNRAVIFLYTGNHKEEILWKKSHSADENDEKSAKNYQNIFNLIGMLEKVKSGLPGRDMPNLKAEIWDTIEKIDASYVPRFDPMKKFVNIALEEDSSNGSMILALDAAIYLIDNSPYRVYESLEVEKRIENDLIVKNFLGKKYIILKNGGVPKEFTENEKEVISSVSGVDDGYTLSEISDPTGEMSDKDIENHRNISNLLGMLEKAKWYIQDKKPIDEKLNREIYGTLEKIEGSSILNFRTFIEYAKDGIKRNHGIDESIQYLDLAIRHVEDCIRYQPQ